MQILNPPKAETKKNPFLPAVPAMLNAAGGAVGTDSAAAKDMEALSVEQLQQMVELEEKTKVILKKFVLIFLQFSFSNEIITARYRALWLTTWFW